MAYSIPASVTLGYLPVAGTWAADDGWVINDADPLTQFLSANGNMRPIRMGNGRPWNWSTKLQGLWWTGEREWHLYADAFGAFMDLQLPEHRNAIAHSHGGQLVILACAKGLKLRSLTTFGTPRRRNLPAEAAAQNIQMWQHVYDKDRDWMGTLKRVMTLGAIGDHHLARGRMFDIPGVQNIPLTGISHSTLLRDPSKFHLWIDRGIIDRIRHAEDFGR